MNALKRQWATLTSQAEGLSLFDGDADGSGGVDAEWEAGKRRLVVAHFMLGNTYPFTDEDWHATFDQAEEYDLDALALNIGPEEWQHAQALSAFRILSSRQASHPETPRRLTLFISMDMNVLPASSSADAAALRKSMGELLRCEPYLRWGTERRRVLSTFSGHEASMGGEGWEGWLRGLAEDLGEKVFFWPAFFQPPMDLLHNPSLDGVFSWNSAWPMTAPLGDPGIHSTCAPNLTISDPLLFPVSASYHPSPSTRPKAYMTSISPCFYTHYGTSGEWAWGKNWLYASDALLYPARWAQLVDLPRGKGPDVVQVVSWNDFGESHYVAPEVRGAQPGSEAWTAGMGHGAFAEMTRFWAGRWRDEMSVGEALRREVRGKAGVEGDEEGEEVDGAGHLGKVWMWYRPHPADIDVPTDERGKPQHTDWAEDLINVVVVLPESPRLSAPYEDDEPNAHAPITSDPDIELEAAILNGEDEHGATVEVAVVPLRRGEVNMFRAPFVPGDVRVVIRRMRDLAAEGFPDVSPDEPEAEGVVGARGGKGTIWNVNGKRIMGPDEMMTYNYNFWSGGWVVDLGKEDVHERARKEEAGAEEEMTLI